MTSEVSLVNFYYYYYFFFFNDTATTEIYTLSLHDALPISSRVRALLDERKALSNEVAQLRRELAMAGGAGQGGGAEARDVNEIGRAHV